MNWINQIILILVQLYLAIIFYSILSLSSLLRIITNKKSIKIGKKGDQASYWIDKNEDNFFNKITSDLFFMLTQKRSIVCQNAIILLKKAKIDYLLILILLLPAKFLLKTPKSEIVDPSFYVMY